MEQYSPEKIAELEQNLQGKNEELVSLKSQLEVFFPELSFDFLSSDSLINLFFRSSFVCSLEHLLIHCFLGCVFFIHVLSLYICSCLLFHELSYFFWVIHSFSIQ